jgi:hypothetical protein
VVAATGGNGTIDVTSELQLAKAGMLYGDDVTLISPSTTALMRLEGMRSMSVPDLLEIVTRTSSSLEGREGIDDSDLHQIVANRDLLEMALPLLDVMGDPPGGEEAQAIREGLAGVNTQIAEVVDNLSNASGLSELRRARESRLVRIEEADGGDAFDLIANSIRSAAAQQAGQDLDSDYSETWVQAFLDRLKLVLESRDRYLLLDESLAAVLHEAIALGRLRIADQTARRSTQVTAAASLMGRIPSFPGATVDEVIDIRRNLDPSLARFRTAMADVAKDFTTSPWEQGFGDEADALWTEMVYPAIDEITDSIRADRGLLELAQLTVDPASDVWPGIIILASGSVAHMPLLTLTGGALTVLKPLIAVMSSLRDNSNSVRVRPFYFLYDLERTLTS